MTYDIYKLSATRSCISPKVLYRRVDVPKSRKRDEESGLRQSGQAAAGVGTEASAASLAQCVSHLVKVRVRVRVRGRGRGRGRVRGRVSFMASGVRY